jgi:hypothetical protein
MLTINETLALCKMIRERANELKHLRDKLAVKDRFYGQADKVSEPQYSVTFVDQKIVELENFLFRADAKIKQSNAITMIEVNENVDSLLAPLKTMD